MDQIELLIKRYETLKPIKNEIIKAYEIIKESYKNGGKLLACGNGGSAADSEHIVGELMKCFKKKRELDNDLKEKL